MTGQRIRTTIVICVLVIAVIVGWRLVYPSASDPRNIEYVFWKAGLYRLNLDTAVETMIGDASRDKLVIGKTKIELRNKFGYLVKPGDASQYLRDCYENSSWKGKQVLFIRSSPLDDSV